MFVQPISNTFTLNSNNNVATGTAVLVVNSGSTDRTLVIANTVGPATGGGVYDGTGNGFGNHAEIYINSGEQIVVYKKGTDVMVCLQGSTDLKATKVATGSG